MKKETISPFVLAMITVALLVTLRGLPLLAGYGYSSIFYYLFAAVFFLIPLSLISAELATTYPEKGGIFLWIAKAFGEKWGFMATFLQWMESIIWYPTALSFIAASLSYLIDPALAENKFYTLTVVLIIYWGATLINFRGLKTSGIVSTFAVIFGSILPALVIVGAAIIWVAKGNTPQITFSWDTFFPDFSNIKNIVFLAGCFLVFAGIEVSAVHVKNVMNPRKNYPKAIGLAVLIILCISISGTLAIGIVVPKEDISLVAGVMQAFKSFFTHFDVNFLIPVTAGLISFGALGQILSWIIGPSKSMLESARRGDIPPIFKKVNKHEIPIAILIAQGIIVSFLSIVFLMMPNVSSSFWILSVLAIQDYIIVYMMLYIAAIVLRYKDPNVKRTYQVPGKKVGIWILSSIGFVVAFSVFLIGFIPPSDLPKESETFFVVFLVIGIVLLISIPLIIYSMKHKWNKGK